MRTTNTHLLWCLTLLFAACSFDSSAPPSAGFDVVTDADGRADGDGAGDDVAEDGAEADTGDGAQDDSVESDAVEDAGDPLPVTCDEDDDCADSLECTSEHCGDDGMCVREISAGSCLINNVCRSAGQAHPVDPCQACDAGTDAFGWTPKAPGAGCDDGDLCTLNTTCDESGSCVGVALECEDAEECTANECDPETGCVFPPTNEGGECDDGSECTLEDACNAGECVGTTRSCDDNDPCTDDACDPSSGCQNANNTAPCDDGDLCTTGDLCAEGECVPGGETNCNNGNICDIDLCNPFAGCYHLPTENPCCIGETSICDDNNPCTDDLCDGDGGCANEANTASCDDGNACTDTDVCADETCAGDEITCDDSNSCTDNQCNPSVGCVYVNDDEATCSDGFECTVGDHCSAGRCDSDDSGCVCEPEFSEAATKLTVLLIGEGGHEGEALDLDGDPTTCTPAADCSDGYNNALGIIAGVVNPSLVTGVEDGSLILVVELRDFERNPFDLAMHTGELDPASAECDVQADLCSYQVSRDAIDPDTCGPLISMQAQRVGDMVFAGGRGTVFPFEIPLGESVLSLVLFDVQLEATITEQSGQIATLEGVLGGAVRRSDLLAAINALDPDSLPFPPAAVAGLLEAVVVDDIDTDDDDEPDAASIAIKLAGIRAIISGVN